MNTEKLIRGIERLKMIAAKFRQQIGRVQNAVRGCDFAAEDWDNLLILDACRYDMFERLNHVPGKLERRRSSGSSTREFLHNTFSRQTYYDIVYVTANPFVTKDMKDAFHATVDLWQTDWDEDLDTVPPDVVRRGLIDAAEQYPNKRLIGHFVQPHHPFIGPTGRSEIEGTTGNSAPRQRALGTDGEALNRGDTVWDLAERGDITIDVLRRAYDENLEVALTEVDTLLDELDGLTVVTSDHGNLIDESPYDVFSIGSRRFAHPPHATAPELVQVPWLICESDGRRRHVQSEPPQSQAEAEEDVVNERLKALGYT